MWCRAGHRDRRRFRGRHVRGTEVQAGSARLKRGVLEEFTAAALPAGMTATQWAPPAGAATLAGGNLVVDGARVVDDPTAAAPRVLELRAAFGAARFQHIGFGNGLEDAPWAMFSTGGGALPIGLFARTNVGGAAVDTPLAGIDPLVAHNYKIEWTPTQVIYSVDGLVRHTDNAAFTQAMRPVISDFDAADGATVTVESMVRDRYPASGTLVSRVFDSGDSRAAWGTLTATGDATGVVFATRSGNTAAPERRGLTGPTRARAARSPARRAGMCSIARR